MSQDSSPIEETHANDHLFFKAKSYKLEKSFHGSRITEKKKKNQSIILKIKMKLEEYICKMGLYH